MESVQKILCSDQKPKEKQQQLVKAVCSGKIAPRDLIVFFEAAPDKDKGSCADAMKHISEQKPEILVPYADVLVKYINHKVPRVMWGIPETFGNLAKKSPEKTLQAIPFLIKNTVENSVNTTVIRWCAAYGLSEIAKNSSKAREQLVPWMKKTVKKEKNNGVKNVYMKALKAIEKAESL